MDVLSAELPAKYNHAVRRQKPSHTEVTSLHSAVWKNQPEHVRQLLEDGAATDTQDGESGWTALHRAFYWGHFRCAAVLLAANAHLSLTDFKGRTALDLLSEELKGFMEHEQAGLVYSWGNGANYQLGTGATGLQAGAVRLDALRKELVVHIAAAKYHSAAVTKHGQLFTWGFGRGGRLGHLDFHVHSGESAIIVPRAVTGLGRRQVAVVAVAKHHTAVATTSFELFTWGSNRDGRLGYAAVDTQPTPRKVTSLKQKVVAVAAANKHTAILTDGGAIFSWGSNDQGQLGYGTSDSASNAVPRQVEAMKALHNASRHTVGLINTNIHQQGISDPVKVAQNKPVWRGKIGAVCTSEGNAFKCQMTRYQVTPQSGFERKYFMAVQGKRLVAVAAAKRHMVMMTSDGDIYTWGHRVVTPRRVQLAGARDVARAGGFGEPVAFHKGQSEISRPHAVAITAGVAHSCCLTRSGVVLAWRSWDANLAVQEVCAGLAGKKVVSIAAGKYRTAAVTDEGDVYMWEGLSKQHPHRKKAAKDASLPPRPDKAASRRLPLSDIITPERVEGLKRVSKACVGEKHSLALQSWCHSPKQLRLPILAAAAALPSESTPHPNADAEDFAELAAQAEEDAEWTAAADRSVGSAVASTAAASAVPCQGNAEGVGVSGDWGRGEGTGGKWLGRDFWVGLETAHQKIQAARAQAEASEYYQDERSGGDSIPSLQRLCERSLAEHAVEPRTCLQIMEYADACGAEVLKQFCLGIALSNLDTVLLEARGVLENIGPHLLAEMEDIQKAQFYPACPPTEALSSSKADQAVLSRRPTAAASQPEGDKELGSEEGLGTGRRSSLVGQALVPSPSSTACELSKERSFCNPEDTEEAAAIGRQIRNLKKKLQQIEALEARQQDTQLDPQQQAKLAQRAEVLAALEALQAGASLVEAHKVALSQRALLPASFSSSSLNRSPSTLSMDSSNGKLKQAGGKHKLGPSRASRQDLSEQPNQALTTDLSLSTDAGAAALPAAADDAKDLSTANVPECVQDAAELTPSRLIPTGPTHAESVTPAAELSTALSTAQQTAAAAAADTAGSSVKPSAWGSCTTASSPVASLRISGFTTLLGQKAEGTAWSSPIGGPMTSPAPLGSSLFSTPPSSGAAKKTKPPRKGGLSMFLSGELEKAATPPPPPPPPPTPAAEFSWGGPKHSPSAQSLTSLRDIQNQEAAVTQKPELHRSSSQLSGLSNSRSKASKQEASKERESRDQAVDLLFDRNRVPLEALVRKSSPIAMVKKEEPSEPQGPAWGGVLVGASPPGPGAEAVLQEAKPRLSDIQAEQERVRESCSRSFGAAGSSPGSGGRDGFATFLQWRGGSGGGGPATGSSPGALFPAGTSPHTAKKMYTPSPQQNSKWYIKEERPVVALQDIQSEEYSRELQAQQEAAAAKVQAEEAAAAAAAQKALRKKQRQQRQARAKAASQSKQQEAQGLDSAQAPDAAQSRSSPIDGASPTPTEGAQTAGTGTAEPLQAARAQSDSAAAHKSAAQKGSGGNRRAKAKGQTLPVHPIASADARSAGANALEHPRDVAPCTTSNRPRVLEVRRPKRHFARSCTEDSASLHASVGQANGVQADASIQQQLHT